MANSDSTSNAFTESQQSQDGTEKIDQVRALIAGAMAMLEDDESETAADARIILKRARHDAHIARLLFEGFSLTQAEEFERVGNAGKAEATHG